MKFILITVVRGYISSKLIYRCSCAIPAGIVKPVFQDKENAPQTGKKFRKLRRGDESSSKFYESAEPPAGSSQENLPGGASSKCGYKSTPGALVTRLLDPSFIAEGVIPSPRQAEEYFLGRRPDSSKLDKTRRGDSSGPPSSLDNTLVELNPLDTTLTCGDSGDELAQGSNRPRQYSDPPPLPPKPKHIPVKASVWGANGAANPANFRAPVESSNSRFLRPSEAKRDARVCRSRRAVYLDQPSSSFV